MTNQVNTLTNQDVMLDLYKIHAYIPNDAAGNTLTPFGNFCEGYQAATQASEIEINSLKERVEELQASNNKLREALELARKEYEVLPHSLGYEFTHLPIIYKALSSTPENKIE